MSIKIPISFLDSLCIFQKKRRRLLFLKLGYIYYFTLFSTPTKSPSKAKSKEYVDTSDSDSDSDEPLDKVRKEGKKEKAGAEKKHVSIIWFPNRSFY